MGYDVSFFKAGSLPGPLKFQRREWAPVWCLLSHEPNEGNPRAEERIVGRLLQRYFQRGINAAPTGELEQRTIQLADPEGACRPAQGEQCGYEVLETGHRPNMRLVRRIIARQNGDHNPTLDPSLREAGTLFDSETERIFLDWAQRVLGPSAARLWPQFPMSAIAGDINGERRVDFLYEGKTAKRRRVIEIDGDDHKDWHAVDESREDSMAKAGVKTIRIKNHEVHDGTGPNLAELEEHVRKEQEEDGDIQDERSSRWADAINMADEGTAFQILLSRMLADGSLSKVNGPAITVAVTHARPHSLEEAFNDWRELARAFSQIHGMGAKIRLPSKLRLVPANEREQKPHIRVDGLCAWWHTTGRGGPAHVLRRVESNWDPQSRIDISPEWQESRGTVEETVQRDALQTILKDAFRFKHFREAQATAIGRCLNGKDTIVLLPTSAGKSLIYQMVSLLKPGPTIVVAPLIALIEDQIDALRSFGIDRVEGITSLDNEKTRKDKMDRLMSGATLIAVCSPERLMIRKFRDQVRRFVEKRAFAQFVIDEAHCISEWGHQFRPAYLQLGRTVKKKMGAPTVLALTGTASRIVYRDMVAHLEIDDRDPEATIRPLSHDRREIKMELRYCTTRREAQGAAEGALTTLPDRFNDQRFWKPRRGIRTKCGIIFMPTAGGQGNSILDGKKLAQRCGARAIETYSGSEKKQRRTDAARNFKNDDASTMVCTRAYGMGVDKGNVRWVLHPHLTGSLEGYYQEIGRAGRKKELGEAFAIAVMHEENEARTNAILDQRKGWSEAKEEYERGRFADDVGTSLYFHFRNFHGTEEESATMMAAIDKLAPSSGRGERILSLPDDDDRQKALLQTLGRLTRIRVVGDYELDYGRKAVFVDVVDWDVMQGIQGLVEYVGRYDKAQSQEVERSVNAALEVHGSNADAQIRLVAAKLVDFVSTRVEHAHRHALLETVLMARACQTDEEVRTRMLEYLTEGKSSEKIASLLNSSHIDWKGWLKLFDGVAPDTQMDAGELRGMVIRALESQADHPALLACRAATEALCNDGVFDTVEQNLQTAVANLQRYATGERLHMERDNLAQFIRKLGETNPSLIQATRLVFGPWAVDEDAKTFGELVSAWSPGAGDAPIKRLEGVWGVLRQVGMATKTLRDAQVRLDTRTTRDGPPTRAAAASQG